MHINAYFMSFYTFWNPVKNFAVWPFVSCIVRLYTCSHSEVWPVCIYLIIKESVHIHVCVIVKKGIAYVKCGKCKLERYQIIDRPLSVTTVYLSLK